MDRQWLLSVRNPKNYGHFNIYKIKIANLLRKVSISPDDNCLVANDDNWVYACNVEPDYDYKSNKWIVDPKVYNLRGELPPRKIGHIPDGNHVYAPQTFINLNMWLFEEL